MRLVSNNKTVMTATRWLTLFCGHDACVKYPREWAASLSGANSILQLIRIVIIKLLIIMNNYSSKNLAMLYKELMHAWPDP